MALNGNRSVLLKSPGRFLNAGVAKFRSAFGQHGMMRNAAFDSTAARPAGHLSPSAWMLPRKAGSVSSINFAVVSLNSQGSGSMGKNAQGSAEIDFAASGTAGLISSATGVAVLALSLSGNIFASKSASGVAGMVLGAAGTLSALGHLSGIIPGVVMSASWNPYAVGWLSGTTAKSEGMTPDAVAKAVWQAMASEFSETGSMGARLNAAGSGGVDYESLAAAVWNSAMRTLTQSNGLTLGQFLALKDI